MIVICSTPRAGMLTLLIFLLGQSVFAAPPSPDELFSNYISSTKILDHAKFRVAEQLMVSGGQYKDGLIQTSGEWLCLRDGNRWRLEFDGYRQGLANGKISREDTSFIYLIPDKGTFLIFRIPGTRTVKSVFAHLALPEEVRLALSAESDFMAVFGFVQGVRDRPYLPDVFRASKLSVESDEAGDKKSESWVLVGKGKYGTIRLWLNESRNYLPNRIEILKEQSDIYGAEPVSAIPELISVSVKVTVTGFQLVASTNVMSEFTVEQANRYRDKTVVTSGKFRLSDIMISPRFSASDFAITTEIPEGTSVQVDDSPNINYVWEGGRLVTAIDSKTVSNLEGHEFIGGQSQVRSLLIVVNILAVIMIVVAIAFRRLKSKKAS